VTGGTGFIGSNLVNRLLSMKADVRVIDDLSTGSSSNLNDGPNSLEVIWGDILDPEVLREGLDDREVVFHLAAIPSVARSVTDPATTYRVNSEGCLRVLLASRDAGVRRVIFASSSSIYGDNPTLPKHEGLPPAPASPYAASKLAGEAYCQAFSHSYGLETLCLRFFNVFGPRQDPASEYAAVVPKFVTRMLEGKPPLVFGDGHQSRDFTYIDNAVEACILAATALEPQLGEVLNAGFGARTTLLELIDMISDSIGVPKPDPSFGEPRAGDVRHSEASIDKARELLGYEPSVSVKEGLTEMVRWFSEKMKSEAATR
jgi:UDP-glucose 4-epimerase